MGAQGAEPGTTLPSEQRQCQLFKLRFTRPDETSDSQPAALRLFASRSRRRQYSPAVCGWRGISAGRFGQRCGSKVKLQLLIASIRRNEPRTRGFLMRQEWLLLLLMMTVALVGCSQRAVQPRIEEPYPKRLSEWHLFTASAPHLRPNSRVVPYDLNTP